MLDTLQLTRVALKILGKFKGKLGEIAIYLGLALALGWAAR